MLDAQMNTEWLPLSLRVMEVTDMEVTYVHVLLKVVG